MTVLRRGIALAAVIATAGVLLAVSPARAQETTGRITGRVTDMGTGQPMAGITVILQGQQGEDAALTDDSGQYTFVNLQVGKYVVRFYNANSSTKVERPDLVVSAGATLRADAAIPSQAAVEETYVITRKAAAVDIGSAKLGTTFGEDYMQYVPVDRTFGDLMLKAPGAFLESSGAVSINGSSGLENTYIMDGVNVTGLEYGDIMNRRSDSSGGSNLNLNFIKELQVNTGGYNAEFGGAMGGMVNVVTKSGSNEFHGSAFMYWSPYWLSGDSRFVLKKDSALVGVDKPDYDANLGFEVGGPILRNKLFFWVGLAPRHEKSHYFRDVLARVDADGDGVPDVDAATGELVTNHLLRTRTKELRQSYQWGTKIDYLAAPDHRLTVGLFGTPTWTDNVRAFAPGSEAIANPQWAERSMHKNNTDISANWVSQFLDRRLRVDANIGLHREDYGEKSPHSNLNSVNQLEWWGANLYDLEGIAGCAPQAYTDSMGMAQTFQPCPVENYHNGGYGLIKNFTGNRWMADLKATFLINRNEIKAGIRGEYNTFDQTRYYTGPTGNRVLVQNYPGQTAAWSLFSLPKGKYPFQFTDDDPSNGQLSDLTDPNMPYYRDQLVANVKSVNTAYFIQDTVRPVTNVTANFGLRYENQTLYDYRGDQFLSLGNIGPRFGVIYDPTNEGRSKIFANYGRFFETIPMNLAARYFGGEGIAIRRYDNTMCTNPPSNWTGQGTGEWDTCGTPGHEIWNAGANYPVQPKIKGQYHDEIVAGFRRALTDDLVVGVDYTHRWLGSVIEDGTASGDFGFVLGNPGQIPQDVLRGLEKDITSKEAQVAAETDPATKLVRESELGALQSKLANLTGLAKEPKPERTYDAITLSANKRLAKNWMMTASYTYSRLIGNYNGLYDADNNYFAPNGGNAYDTPELVLNRRGPLANDRPHAGRVDGFYQLPVGRGSIIAGVSFSAYSGVPRNYIGALIPGQQLIFLLPRGAAGRTPAVTQTDVKFAYHRDLSKTTAIEAFVDFFNVFNERTALQMDDNYTFDMVAPIVNGSTNDLKYAINYFGTPVTKNPNFGEGTVFQRPFNGRMGLRFLF